VNEPKYGWWLPPDVSVHGADVDFMIIAIHWFMLLLFVGWGAFIVYCLVRFRQRPGHVAVHQPIEARWNRWIEAGVVVAEAVVLVAFAIPVWATIKTVTPEVPANPLVVRVVAEQFKWLFHYPGKDGEFGRTAPEFYAETTRRASISTTTPAGMTSPSGDCTSPSGGRWLRASRPRT